MALGGSRVEQQRLDLNVGALLPLNRCRTDAAGEVNSTSSTKTDSTSVQSSRTSSTTSIVPVVRYIVVQVLRNSGLSRLAVCKSEVTSQRCVQLNTHGCYPRNGVFSAAPLLVRAC